MLSPLCTTGVPPASGAAPGGAGWPGQSSRFLHMTPGFYHHYQARFVHDTVVARLSPEDMKKAREAKQALVKPVRQKVGFFSLLDMRMDLGYI